jgi:hypothetical protein
VKDRKRENRRLHDELIRIIREKIKTNALPTVVPLRAKSGKGDGQACSGCDTPIEPVHTEWVLEFAGVGTVRFHADCERIWRERIDREVGLELEPGANVPSLRR